MAIAWRVVWVGRYLYVVRIVEVRVAQSLRKSSAILGLGLSMRGHLAVTVELAIPSHLEVVVSISVEMVGVMDHGKEIAPGMVTRVSQRFESSRTS